MVYRKEKMKSLGYVLVIGGLGILGFLAFKGSSEQKNQQPVPAGFQSYTAPAYSQTNYSFSDLFGNSQTPSNNPVQSAGVMSTNTLDTAQTGGNWKNPNPFALQSFAPNANIAAAPNIFGGYSPVVNGIMQPMSVPAPNAKIASPAPQSPVIHTSTPHINTQGEYFF